MKLLVYTPSVLQTFLQGRAMGRSCRSNVLCLAAKRETRYVWTCEVGDSQGGAILRAHENFAVSFQQSFDNGGLVTENPEK